MQLDNLKKSTEPFRAHVVTSLDDPTGQIERHEMLIPLDQYPHDFGLGPNPRLPVLSSPVSRMIGETLEKQHKVFHHLNRGVTIVAKAVKVDPKTQTVTLTLHEKPFEEAVYGILDGGNTNRRINAWREELTDAQAAKQLPETFVNATILVPKTSDAGRLPAVLVDLMNDIKEARNTSVQVKSKSLADSRRHFAALKEALRKEPYFEHISWREGQPGNIDALQIVMFLMIYYPSFSATTGEPYAAYGHKERTLEAYLGFADTEPDKLERWVPLAPALVRLFDELQVQFPELYSGRFGKIDEVRIHDEHKAKKDADKYRKNPAKSILGQPMKYQYPIGWLYPLFAAFRHLAKESKSGVVIWQVDPVRFFREHAAELLQKYEPVLKQAAYNPKVVGQSFAAYQGIGSVVELLLATDLRKDKWKAKARPVKQQVAEESAAVSA